MCNYNFPILIFTGEQEVDLMEELLDSAENFDELNDVADDKASKHISFCYKIEVKEFLKGDDNVIWGIVVRQSFPFPKAGLL